MSAGLATMASGMALSSATAALKPPERRKTSTPRDKLTSDLMQFADAHRREHDIPGMTVAVADANGWQANFQLGLADVDRGVAVDANHLFQIGSISKSFTALCVFALIEAGKLSLQSRLSSVLPELAFEGARAITVQHLLDHSSGLPANVPAGSEANASALWTGFEPGTGWSYSNAGYALLGHIIAKAAGMPFAKALQTLVLAPLKMDNTRPSVLAGDRAAYANGYGPLYPDRPFPITARKTIAPWVNHTAGSGSIASTAADMVRYIQFLLSLAKGLSNPLLGRDLAKLFVKPTIDAPGWGKGAAYGQGLAFVSDGQRRLLHHTGGMIAFSSALHIDVENGFGAFASVNVGHPTYRPRAVTLAACRLAALGNTGLAKADKSAPSSFAGRYRNAVGSEIAISGDADTLQIEQGANRIAFVADGDLQFIARNPAQTSRIITSASEAGIGERFWWGPDEYVRLSGGAPVTPFSSPLSADIAALAGTYENNDPWYDTVRVFAVGNRLTIGGTDALKPTGKGYFETITDNPNAERISFHNYIGGRPQLLDISGVRYGRCDEVGLQI